MVTKYNTGVLPQPLIQQQTLPERGRTGFLQALTSPEAANVYAGIGAALANTPTTQGLAQLGGSLAQSQLQRKYDTALQTNPQAQVPLGLALDRQQVSQARLLQGNQETREAKMFEPRYAKEVLSQTKAMQEAGFYGDPAVQESLKRSAITAAKLDEALLQQRLQTFEQSGQMFPVQMQGAQLSNQAQQQNIQQSQQLFPEQLRGAQLGNAATAQGIQQRDVMFPYDIRSAQLSNARAQQGVVMGQLEWENAIADQATRPELKRIELSNARTSVAQAQTSLEYQKALTSYYQQMTDGTRKPATKESVTEDLKGALSIVAPQLTGSSFETMMITGAEFDPWSALQEVSISNPGLAQQIMTLQSQITQMRSTGQLFGDARNVVAGEYQKISSPVGQAFERFKAMASQDPTANINAIKVDYTTGILTDTTTGMEAQLFPDGHIEILNPTSGGSR